MPSVVFKYRLGGLNEMCSIKLPREAEILSVGFDPQGDLSLWAIVDPAEEEEEEHVFLIIGTGMGYELPKQEEAEFLATLVREEFVYHVFEVIR